MPVDWINVAVSFLSGAGGAAVLDMWFKPRQACRRAAVLLRAEVRTNRDHLRYRMPRETGVGVWKEFVLPTVAFEAATSDLGDLPLPVAEAVVRLYHSYVRVLRAYETHLEAFNEVLRSDDHDGSLQKNFEVTRATLSEMMEATVAESNRALGMLDSEAAKSLLPGRRLRRTG